MSFKSFKLFFTVLVGVRGKGVVSFDISNKRFVLIK